MLPTVARWFVLDARETVDNLVQVWGVTCGYDNNVSLSNSEPTEPIFL
jgi:hypothetical protein